MNNEYEKLNDEQKYEILMDEKRFPYEGMNLEERNYYLNIIRNCKDVCDTENKVDGISKCELVEMSLIKKDFDITFNGSLYIGTKDKHEYRSIEGYLFFEKNSILVDYKITRICVEDIHKEYTLLDEFTLENDNLMRSSRYNYNMESITEKVQNDEMKGRLK